MGKKLTPDQIPQDAPIISTTSSFEDIREGQVFGLVCKKCGKIQYRRFKRKNIAVYNKMLCISCEQSERQTKYVVDKENPVLVTTSDEVASLPLNQPFKFICKRCKKEIVIKCAGERAASRFTGYCVNCYQSVFSPTPLIDRYVNVTDPNQFNNFNRHQRFIIKCKMCGNEQKHETFNKNDIPKYSKFLCTKCARSIALTGNQNGYKNETHVEIHITDPKQFDSMISRRPYSYICKRCGKLQHVKEYDPRRIEFNKQMICNDCSKFRFTYDNISFDSSWELAIWIYAKDHNIPIEREPVKLSFNFDGKEKHVIPDFRYDGKLIEIKGEHYYDKKHDVVKYPYKFKETDVPLNECEINRRKRLLKAKFDCYDENDVAIWGKNECKPFIDYVNSTYGSDYIFKFKKK